MLDIKITRTATPKAKPTDETKLGFGKKFSDHMFVMDYDEAVSYTHLTLPTNSRV